MTDDDTTYSPFKVWKYEEKYCLMLSDNHMVDVMDTFEANGRYGNGYAWADLALGVIRTRFPVLEDDMPMDPEAGTFSMTCTNLDDLKRVAAILHEAFHDPKKLAPLVSAAPWEYD